MSKVICLNTIFYQNKVLRQITFGNNIYIHKLLTIITNDSLIKCVLPLLNTFADEWIYLP